VLPATSAARRTLTLYRGKDGKGGDEHTVTIPAPAAALTTSHIDTIRAAALAGLGIAALPSFVIDHALRRGSLERVLPQWRGVTLTLYAAMPSRRHVPHERARSSTSWCRPSSSSRRCPPGSRIEKDGPLDDLADDQDAAGRPWVVVEQRSRFLRVASLHDQQRAAEVRVRSAEDDTSRLEHAVHERGVFAPQRLLPRRHTRHPCRPGIAKDEIQSPHGGTPGRHTRGHASVSRQ
jgi:hypothetical protein